MEHDRNLMCQWEHLFFTYSLNAPIVHLPSSPILMPLVSTPMPLSFVSSPFIVHPNTPLFSHTHPCHLFVMVGLLKKTYGLVVLLNSVIAFHGTLIVHHILSLQFICYRSTNICYNRDIHPNATMPLLSFMHPYHLSHVPLLIFCQIVKNNYAYIC